MKKLLLFAAFIAVLFSLFSCDGRKVDSANAVRAMLKCEKNLPVGTLYTSHSSPGSHDYLSEGILTALYGDDSCPAVFERVSERSVWITSGFSAFEFAVFDCAVPADAEEIASLCVRRAENIEYSLRHGGNEVTANARKYETYIYGNTVIFAFSTSPENCISEAKKAIR